MPYKKFKADYIFTGTELLHPNNILITDENGVIETIIEEENAGDNIEVFKGLISPGFINCHCHLELSHMKNVIQSGTGLVEFLIKVINLRSADKKEIEAAIQTADEEMYICRDRCCRRYKQHNKFFKNKTAEQNTLP